MKYFGSHPNKIMDIRFGADGLSDIAGMFVLFHREQLLCLHVRPSYQDLWKLLLATDAILQQIDNTVKSREEGGWTRRSRCQRYPEKAGSTRGFKLCAEML